MLLTRKLNEQLQGTNDSYITMGLFVLAGVAIGVAIWSPPAMKLAVLAWMVAP